MLSRPGVAVLVVLLAWPGCTSSHRNGATSRDAGIVSADGGNTTHDAGPGQDGGAAATCCTPSFPSPETSVTSFGAVGDGITDDTQALRAAIADVEAKGGTLTFESHKTYLISGKLTFADASGFGIRGNGATLKVANGTPTTDNVPLVFLHCSSFVVADLTIDGNRQNRVPAQSSGGHNVRIQASTNFKLCTVVSKNSTTDGFYVAPTDNTDPTTFPSDGLFCDCHADNSFRQGMSIIAGRRLQVVDSSFTNTNGHSPQAGIDIEPNSGSFSPGAKDISISNTLFEGNQGYGLTMGGAATTDRLTVEGCTFRANAAGGMTARAGWALVKNNLFEHHIAWVGLNIRDATRAHDIVVTGNTFRDNPGPQTGGPAWIYVNADSGTNNYLLDNVFMNNAGKNIANNNPAGTCAAGNVMDGVEDAPPGTCGAPPVVGSGT